MHRIMRSAFVLGLVLLATVSGTLSATEPPGRLSADEARRLVGEIAPRVEALRGLTFRQTVPVEVVDDRVAREYALERVRRFAMEERLEELQRVRRTLRESAAAIKAQPDELVARIGALQDKLKEATKNASKRLILSSFSFKS